MSNFFEKSDLSRSDVENTISDTLKKCDDGELYLISIYYFIMKVYFNNSCKICKAEIDLYKKERIQEINWVDITDNTLATEETSKNSKELLRRLHVKDGEKVLEGAAAFLALWKKMPKYKFLYNFFKLPIIFSLFSIVYEIVAFFLYLKNKKQLKN